MAIYRSVQMSFWTDSKVVEDFTPEDRYFYLYLFSNPHTNLCGCYEITKRQISYEVGYSVEAIEKLIDRFANVHKVAVYSEDTKEMLLLNWNKYNWTSSVKFRTSLLKEINNIKNDSYREYLLKKYGIDTVLNEEKYGIDTTVTVTDTDTVTNTVSEKEKKKKDYFDNPKLNEAFLNYIEMRKKIKRPMTDEAIKRAKSKLENLAGNDDEMKIAIINQSIDKSWNGLFELPKVKQESPPPQNEDKLRELEEMYL